MKIIKSIWTRFKNWLSPINQRFHLGLMALTVFLGIFFIISAYLTVIAKTANVSNLGKALEQQTIIYDNQNQEAGALFNQKGTYVNFDEISQNLKDATLSSEDRNFYHEPGFSVKGIARAFLLNARNKLTGSSAIAGGGSTITQQLAKNAYLSQEQTLTRKLKELFIAIQIEKHYTKDEIFTMYLNNAYFGHNTWGVEDASLAYFGVHASDLSTAQAAMLTGMLANPTIYDPTDEDYYQNAKNRQSTVLNSMVENEKLTAEQADSADNQSLDLVGDFSQPSSSYNKYPWFFDSVISEAINELGMNETDIMNRGYSIYTSMDQTDQTNLQNDYQNDGLFPVDDQSATVVLDAKTGAVNATVGGRGEHVFRGFNRAVDSRRQPGSTIKPIAVYAPALARGFHFDSMLPNQEMEFKDGNQNYRPSNALEYTSDDVPMYQALEFSYNIPAVFLLDEIGVEAGYNSVQRFGLPVTKEDKSLSLALGGMNQGVSPIEMAQAYTAFANDGKMSKAHFINRIVDASGNTIYEYSPDSSQVMSPSVAQDMTSMMIGTYTSGTGAAAKPAGITLAGKTGTTEDVNNAGIDNASKDQWAIAYTPDFVVASWQGFDQDLDGQYLQLGIESSLGPLFSTQAAQLYANSPQTPFTTTDANNRGAEIDSFIGEVFNNFGQNVRDGWDTVLDYGRRGWDSLINGFRGN